MKMFKTNSCKFYIYIIVFFVFYFLKAVNAFGLNSLDYCLSKLEYQGFFVCETIQLSNGRVYEGSISIVGNLESGGVFKIVSQGNQPVVDFYRSWKNKDDLNDQIIEIYNASSTKTSDRDDRKKRVKKKKKRKKNIKSTIKSNDLKSSLNLKQTSLKNNDQLSLDKTTVKDSDSQNVSVSTKFFSINNYSSFEINMEEFDYLKSDYGLVLKDIKNLKEKRKSSQLVFSENLSSDFVFNI